jgi:alpha-glucoside transport system substrate-binding protein
VRWPAELLRRLVRLTYVTAVATLVATIAACGDDDQPSARPVVEVFGPVVGDSGTLLAGVLREASATTAIDLRYIGVTSFNEQLEERLARGDRPGIALLPQPGLLHDLTQRGLAVPLPSAVAAATQDDYPAQLVDLVTADGAPAAVWLTIDIKSLVWYRPDEFDARGLTVPTTLDELTELSERIRTADNAAPWCLTMEAGSSTGWVGTDWIEDYVLRRLGPTQYTHWTTGELRFRTPSIRAVFEELDTLLRAPGAIAGGQRAILTVPWERTAELLTGDAATCVMTHQGDFLRREFPSTTTIGPQGDVDFFVLPGADSSRPPLLVGGMLATPLGDAPEVGTAINILSGADVAERLNRTTEFLSPHLGVGPDDFDDDATSTRLLELVASSSDIQFDGSDLMPAAVGTGTFWTGMQAFFTNEQLDVVLTGIDAGWSDAQQ